MAALAPLTAGAMGVLDPGSVGIFGDSAHAAYLSGLLLGIGLAYWSLLPDIEKRSTSFTLLTAIVAAGGLARLSMAAGMAYWPAATFLPLLMELGVTPLLWLWQRRIARRQKPKGPWQ